MKADTTTVRAANLTVMVVDDDKIIRGIIIEQLRTIGFQKFLEASDGAEAFKMVIDPLTRIDLVICDWEMPKADGLTLLHAVRQSRQRADLPFIMVTSQQSQERMKISRAKHHLVDAYIVKPFRAEILRAKVFQVLFNAIDKKTLGA